MTRSALAGQRLGMLTVLEQCGATRWGNLQWRCRCDCGSTVVVAGGHLNAGHTKSCGCLSRQLTTARNLKHGLTVRGALHPLFHTWVMMRRRCYERKNHAYRLYGGRGITVCARWRDDFAAFVADVGERPFRRTLDRIDNNGNYEPGNVRWATWSEQIANQRRRRRR